MSFYWSIMDSLSLIQHMPPTPPDERVATPPPALATMSSVTPYLPTMPSSYPLPSALRTRHRSADAPLLAFQLPGQPPPPRSNKRKPSDEPDDAPKPKRETHRNNERRFKMPLKALFAEASGHKDKAMANRLGSRLKWGSYDGFTGAQRSGRSVISHMEYRRGKIEGVLDEVEEEWDADVVDDGLGDMAESEEQWVEPPISSHDDRGAILAECRAVFVDYTASIQNYEDTHDARILRLRRSNKLESSSLEVPQRLLPHNIVAEWTASILPDLLAPTPQPAEAKVDESDVNVSLPLSHEAEPDPQRFSTPPPSPRPRLQPATPPPAADEFRTMGLNASPGQRSIHFRRTEVDQHAARLRGLLGSLTDMELFDQLNRKATRDTQNREQRAARMFANCLVKPEPGEERTPLAELDPSSIPPSIKTCVSKGVGILNRTGAWSFLKSLDERRSASTGGDAGSMVATTRPKRIRTDGLLLRFKDIDGVEEQRLSALGRPPSTEMSGFQCSVEELESVLQAPITLDDTEDDSTSAIPSLGPHSQVGGVSHDPTEHRDMSQDETGHTEESVSPAGSNDIT
ncbi:uncharacterized protein LOC62_05G007440 [Vanrija pseudolonga]|uniref:Uncharacterized protein n=1 Tax=Vanrija pseudolonga TaxID=143232 RepID=A0AAF1BKF6_9TREE|nr:hypothetical protein LOC62_05G007440 [Vanrija pseudolonga]